MAHANEDSRVPLSWIVIFLLVAFGLGAGAVLMVGGQIVSPAGFLLA